MEQTKPTTERWQSENPKAKGIVQSFMHSTKFLIKLKARLQQRGGEVVYEFLNFCFAHFYNLGFLSPFIFSV